MKPITPSESGNVAGGRTDSPPDTQVLDPAAAIREPAPSETPPIYDPPLPHALIRAD